MTSYHCPCCHKVSKTSFDLVRHMMGRGDEAHRNWISSKGFNYANLLADQASSFGSPEYDRLGEVVEKETKHED